jgi:hypothetical protein
VGGGTSFGEKADFSSRLPERTERGGDAALADRFRTRGQPARQHAATLRQ